MTGPVAAADTSRTVATPPSRLLAKTPRELHRLAVVDEIVGLGKELQSGS